jgi:hypothetical protein
MTDAGYAFVADSDVSLAGNAGYLIELAAPVGIEDYTYAIAVTTHGKDLLIAEATGEVTRFAKHRAAIVDAIKGIKAK